LPTSVHPDVHIAVEPRQRKLWDYALDFVYPRRCLSCGEDMHDRRTDHLCSACWASVEPLGKHKCPRCAAPMGPHTDLDNCRACHGQTLYFKGATAFGMYRSALRELVHCFKYRKHSFLAKPLGDLLARRIEAEPFANDLEVVVPVPIHWRRRFVRGFNQSELLAKRVARYLLLPAAPRAMRRTRLTTPQAFLGSSQRKRNLAGAFDVPKPKIVEGKTVLLIDDVMTTCSTTAECAKVLKAAGAKAVYAATVAR